jgi:hypothetical protein
MCARRGKGRQKWTRQLPWKPYAAGCRRLCLTGNGVAVLRAAAARRSGSDAVGCARGRAWPRVVDAGAAADGEAVVHVGHPVTAAHGVICEGAARGAVVALGCDTRCALGRGGRVGARRQGAC